MPNWKYTNDLDQVIYLLNVKAFRSKMDIRRSDFCCNVLLRAANDDENDTTLNYYLLSSMIRFIHNRVIVKLELN